MTAAQRSFRLPSPPLRPYVEAVRVLRSAGAPRQEVARFPDGRASMLLRVLPGQRGELSLAGPRSRALFKTLPEYELAIMVDFKPGGALPIAGVPLHVLTDRIVLLEDVWGASGARLHQQLLAAGSENEKVAVLERALLARLESADEPGPARLARRAVRLIAEPDAPSRIARLAAQMGVSERHLRRAFRDSVGVGPKEYARMVRLQRALRSIDSTSSWTELATDAGYYDQAHLIAEFRALVGTTPAAWLKRPASAERRWSDSPWLVVPTPRATSGSTDPATI